MSKPSQREQVQKGLQHLKGSDKIIGDIVGYCVQAYKADSSVNTIAKVRKYVEDTANSVSEHVLTIAHNLNRIIDAEAKEIEDLSHQANYVSHRLKSHQRYMSELFMTKFQTFPRPRPTIHILRQAIPENQLPRYARRKRPWQRQTKFDYKILDKVGTKVGASTAGGTADTPVSPRTGASPSGSSASSGYTSKPAVKPFNPASPVKGPQGSPQKSGMSSMSSMGGMGGGKGPTLFQQSQNSGFGFSSNFAQPPPSFGSIDPNMGRGPRASVVKYVGGDDDKKSGAKKGPGGPPAVPPAVPSVPAAAGGPPQPPQPPQPPAPPNFGANFAAKGAGAGSPPQPPVPPVPGGAGGPPQPPVPPVPGGAGGPPQPPVPPVPGGPGGPPPPPM